MSNKERGKGVNLTEFLSKNDLSEKKRKPKTPKKKIEKKGVEKTTPIVRSSKEKVVDTAKIKVEKKTEDKSENTEVEKKSLFKFIDQKGMRNPDLVLSFVKWYALPKEVKKIKTHTEFAQKFGVHIDTLTDWKNLPGFYDEVAIYHFNEMQRFMSDVGYAVVNSAKRGSAKSQELFFKIYMKWSDKIRVEDETPERVILDDEQKKIDNALKNIGLATVIRNNDKKNEEQTGD